MTQENRLPGWLTLDADAALVRLASGTVQRGQRRHADPVHHRA